MDVAWQQQIGSILTQGNSEALLHLARGRTAWVFRYLTGRLCSTGEQEKWQAVWGIGVLVADRRLVNEGEATDRLRRFFWALNDESGAVPYGVPEAIGEILAVRPELQGDFLPLLCSLITDTDRLQTGDIERGVIWALGRLGPPVAPGAAEAVEALRVLAKTHPDRETRELAVRSLASILEEHPPAPLTERADRRADHG